MSYNSKKGHGYGNSVRKAKNVQSKRSSWAKHIDSKLKAPKAKDAEQWLTAPNRFDLPNVDTNKPKKETKSSRVSKEYFYKKYNANKVLTDSSTKTTLT